MTETVVVSLEDYVPVDPLGESWSDEVIWTTMRLKQTLPTPDDEQRICHKWRWCCRPWTVIQVTWIQR